MDDSWSLIYVHGIGSQPPAAELKAQWDNALFGKPCDFSEVAYWADKRLPIPPGIRTFDILSGKSALDPVLDWTTKEFTSEFVHDVNTYLYNDQIRSSILGAVSSVFMPHQNSKKVLVIGHSLGTVVAYEVLRNLGMYTPTYITLGSPLGLDTLRAALRDIRKEAMLELPKLDHWLNYSDPFDIVATDHTLKDDFGNDPRIVDHLMINPDRKISGWFGFHSGAGYLRSTPVKNAVANVLLGAPNE